ncbi:hypothetical protein [Nocardia ignorata]|uniref:Uncharacterized protein n=1 Tax=Nocardia ignorata TaxID=145285 RepID=A0A4R6PHC6_NOCIG|nr:hypothetical protein [Nocardia ignorata]TDP37698.1 hypothetical protein DFR75_10448 [Nocardia ignorata]
MLPSEVKKIESELPQGEWYEAVQNLSVADIESISIGDISTLQNNSLKDLVNQAVQQRLAGHIGGTYTSPPVGSLAEAKAAGI